MRKKSISNLYNTFKNVIEMPIDHRCGKILQKICWRKMRRLTENQCISPMQKNMTIIGSSAGKELKLQTDFNGCLRTL